MGECFINKDIIYEAGINILNDNNYITISKSSNEISYDIWNNVEKLHNKYYDYFGMEWKKLNYYINWRREFINDFNNKKWKKLPIFNPLIKLHKNELGWRRVLNVSDTYNSFFSRYLNEELQDIHRLYQFKIHKRKILENSYDLVDRLIIENKQEPKFKKSTKWLITEDVVKLYDKLTTEDGINGINWICNEIDIDIDRINLFIDIFKHIQNNTYVKFENIIKKQINCFATGYSHSGIVANISLLFYEVKNDYKITPCINKKIIRLNQNVRYFDDLFFILEINMDIIQYNQIQRLLNQFINRIKTLYPINIKLDDIKCRRHLKYLDLEIFSLLTDDGNNSIIKYRISEKKHNKKIYLNYFSNHTYHMKQSIIISQLYRSCILNSSYDNHKYFKIKLYNHLIQNRGYNNAYFIRKTKKPKWNKGDFNLRRMKKKRLYKLEKTILRQFFNFNNPSNTFIKLDYFNFLNKKHEELDNKQIIPIIFKKYSEQLFDKDNKLSYILNETHKLLPEELKRKTKPLICNKIKTKLSRFINNKLL